MTPFGRALVPVCVCVCGRLGMRARVCVWVGGWVWVWVWVCARTFMRMWVGRCVYVQAGKRVCVCVWEQWFCNGSTHAREKGRRRKTIFLAFGLRAVLGSPQARGV